MCITIQFSHRNQPFLLFRLIIFYHIFHYMSIVLSNISSFHRHSYVHHRIMPVIAYQESKAGNSSYQLKRMGEFLQCYVKRNRIYRYSCRTYFFYGNSSVVIATLHRFRLHAIPYFKILWMPSCRSASSYCLSIICRKAL